LGEPVSRLSRNKRPHLPRRDTGRKPTACVDSATENCFWDTPTPTNPSIDEFLLAYALLNFEAMRGFSSKIFRPIRSINGYRYEIHASWRRIVGLLCITCFLSFNSAHALPPTDSKLETALLEAPADGDRGRFGETLQPPLFVGNQGLGNARSQTLSASDETSVAKKGSFVGPGPDDPLTSAIHSGTPARSVAGLRIAEAGRKLLQEGQYARALVRLERALALDANPFVYYYLALLHYRLARYQQSLNFLEVAESRLRAHSGWMTEVSSFKGTVGNALQANLSAVKTKTATPEELPHSVAETEEPRKVLALPNTDGSRVRRYLLLLDVSFLSAFGLFAVLWLSSMRNLRPR
jgi:hypothetical protein